MRAGLSLVVSPESVLPFAAHQLRDGMDLGGWVALAAPTSSDDIPAIGSKPRMEMHQSGVIWCIFRPPKKLVLPMANRRVQSYTAPADRTVRASVSFPEDQYAELERIAQEQRVSLAWVVREAVQTYLVQRWPLLEGEGTVAKNNDESRT